MAKATCVRANESSPCSMKVAEALSCERSRPETGRSRSSTRAAMRSLREDAECDEATLSGEEARTRERDGEARSRENPRFRRLGQRARRRGLPRIAGARKDKSAKKFGDGLRWRRRRPSRWLLRFARESPWRKARSSTRCCSHAYRQMWESLSRSNPVKSAGGPTNTASSAAHIRRKGRNPDP